MKITICGGGGLGANLSFLLASQGHQVTVYDGDVCDKKFLGRFQFHSVSEILNINRKKVDILNQIGKYRGISLVGIDEFVDETHKWKKDDADLVIISTDMIDSRTIIEKYVKKAKIPYFHVGCDLNSVSVFDTMDDIIADDPPPDAQTSYDEIPDALTYLEASIIVARRIEELTKGNKLRRFEKWPLSLRV